MIHIESKIVVGIANTITRAVLTVGMKLAMEYNQMERGVGLVRALGQGSTDMRKIPNLKCNSSGRWLLLIYSPENPIRTTNPNCGQC